ncbi:MAG: Endonuclease Nob1 consisting of PIN domain and Zn-ribbon module [Candidatus Methanohalarchaeum thermophilum]|uniref:Endonuclease Nob1 consisting of PIN domain and Zn-ribbon module n=1 Tax=Methanohalarchaeum thermophilum TaxID=1903181 RepID=A0A1Q6DU06_METT1|nr:MAG: Endonuclease Nob1 consisting of PIN domain and Zn-ribbon module [Candidatus Methanohalarchaeum thermophilum]
MIYVADTSVFITGYIPDGCEEVFTVEKVLEEVKDKFSKLNYISSSVRVYSPDAKYIEETKTEAKSTGDISRISSTDLKLLSLALELKEENSEVKILTDDYSIQNVAQRMSIEYEGIQQPEIDEKFKWIERCEGCKREFEAGLYEKCPVCGSDLTDRLFEQNKISDLKEDVDS